jgi:predicted extracellular nuclease
MKGKTILLRRIAAVAAMIAAAMPLAKSAAAANIAITEWMYSPQGGPGENFELTNVGNSPVDLTGWSQDDNTRNPGAHLLTDFGILQPGESAIGTEGSDAAAFRTYWNLPSSVKVIAYGSQDNIGRSDEINVYDNVGALVDQLTYSDQTIGGPRTQGISANIALANLFQNRADLAVASTIGDSYLSYGGGGGSGDVGNPGVYTPFVSVPEPASIAILMLGAVAAGGFASRRRS